MGAMMGAHHGAHAPNAPRECEDALLERSGPHAPPDMALNTVPAPVRTAASGTDGSTRPYASRVSAGSSVSLYNNARASTKEHNAKPLLSQESERSQETLWPPSGFFFFFLTRPASAADELGLPAAAPSPF